MATKEIITISSDEETVCVSRSESVFNKSDKDFQKIRETAKRANSFASSSKRSKSFNSSKSMQASIQKNFYEIYHKPLMKTQSQRDEIFIINERHNKRNFNTCKTPEVVDLEDCNNVAEITINNSDEKPNIQITAVESHSEIKLIEPNDNNVATIQQGLEFKRCDPSNTYAHVISLKEVMKENSQIVKKTKVSGDNDGPQIPEFFNNFIEHCSSFEKNKTDRGRLIKKLEKRCNAADPKYVKSQEFRTLIEKSMGKINKNSLYLIAKEVTDELSLRKKIEITKTQKNEEVTNEKGQVISEDRKSKKKTKMINKIIKKLDKLGKKIRELEEAEVDLSDEEDSSYILVQRYRERFCQIYKKLCKVMNEPSDANRVFCRKICFSGSKYPAINQCIERWLNKTKRFPDFNDIVKLLESQSSSLGLPSNKESIRATATEIFQEVGKMLQRRRKHDLWDSLCGFLNDDIDPALADPDLDKVLKMNFDTRVKKEQEIFRHYAELQEKERLEPEEVPEEEANLSPIDSGNEDEEEIEKIEKSLSERLDAAIEEEHNLAETDYNWEGGEKNVAEEVESLPQSNTPSTSVKEAETPTQVKESKNNYKNCKSIKYRGENRSKSNEGSSSSKNSFEETNGKEGDKNLNESYDDLTVETKETETKMRSSSSEGEGFTDKENSDVDIVSIGSTEMEIENSDLDKFDFSKIPVVKVMRLPDNLDLDNIKVSGNVWMSPKSEKRELSFDDEAPGSVKRRKTESLALEIDCKNNVEEVFEVHRCQIEHDYIHDGFSFLDDLNEKRKHWDKGKIFRDLTNVGRLMELNGRGRRKKSSGYFSHSIYHPGFPEFPKFSWKKRFRLNYKFVGLKDQKCALSQDDKDSKSVGGDGKDSDGKGVENNSESGGDDGSNFFIGGGSGSEKDNDENDENKRGEKTKDFSDDAKHDEEEEEEEDEEETEDEMSGKNNKKPEGETSLENSFNCSTDDQTSSFNESNATLNRSTTIEKEDETEGSNVEDRSESDIKTKSDENRENSVEMRADELEGTSPNNGDESMSPRNSEKNESEESCEESQGPEEDEVDADKVVDYQIDGDIYEMGQNEVEEKEEDAETGEEDEKEENIETGEEEENDLDVDATETQNKEDDAEISEEERKDEDEGTEEQQEIDLNVESIEKQKEEENLETGEVQEKEEEEERERSEEEEEEVERERSDEEEEVERERNEEEEEEVERERRVEEEKEEEGERSEEKEEEIERSEENEEEIERSEENEEEIERSEENEEEGERSEEKEEGIERSEEKEEEIERSEENEEEIERSDEMKQEIERSEEKEQEREKRVEKEECNKYKELIVEKEAQSSCKKERPLIRLRSLAEMEARLESRFDPRMIPRIDPRMNVRLEPRFGLRMEPRIEPRMEQRVDPRIEPIMEQRVDPRAGLRIDPRIDPRIEQRAELRGGLGVEQRVVDPRIEPRSGLRLEPRTGLRLEPRAGLRLEPRGGLRLEPRTGLRLEPRAGLRVDPRVGLRIEPRAGLRVEPRAELRAGLGVEQRADSRVETRVEQRFERSPLGCKNKRENVVGREINQVNQMSQTVQTIQPIQTSQRKLSTREESSYHGNQESEIEFLGQKIGKRKKTARSPTDEERVKKFLMHSPSSISIIPPKKLTLSKPPSQAALQALETLKGLKGISATRVRSRESKPEDEVVVIGESYSSYSRPQTARKSTGGVKRRNDLPVISSVHSIQSSSTTGSPKIQTFQGSVSGFPSPSQPTTTAAAAAAAAAMTAAAATNNRMKNGPPGQPSNSDSSSIRISSVWGSMPQITMYSRNMSTPGNSESPLPGCSFQKDSSSGVGGSGGGGEGGSAAKKKKKPVEFVVLE